jgi:hypothetical protein
MSRNPDLLIEKQQSKSSRHKLLLAFQPKKESLTTQQASAASPFACMHSASELFPGSKQPCVTRFWYFVCAAGPLSVRKSQRRQVCYRLMHLSLLSIKQRQGAFVKTRGSLTSERVSLCSIHPVFHSFIQPRSVAIVGLH